MRAAFPTYIEVESSETARSGLPEPWNERQVNREAVVPKALRASGKGPSYTAQKKVFRGKGVRGARRDEARGYAVRRAGGDRVQSMAPLQGWIARGGCYPRAARRQTAALPWAVFRQPFRLFRESRRVGARPTAAGFLVLFVSFVARPSVFGGRDARA